MPRTDPTPEPFQDGFLDVRRRPLALVFSTLFILLVDYLDELVGPDLHLSVLLLLPIVWVAWEWGFGTGTLFSVLGSSYLLLEPVLAQQPTLLKREILLWNFVTLLIFYITTAFLVTKFREYFEQVRTLAWKDGLTGLFNTQTFVRLAERERLTALRQGRPFSLCFLDLDDFKGVNDSLGHLAGNELLRSVAEALKEHSRRTDLLARFGGDEFVALFPDTDEAALRDILSGLQVALDRLFQEGGWRVSASLGGATFKRVPPTVDEALHFSDGLLYRAKKKGKHRMVLGTFSG